MEKEDGSSKHPIQNSKDAKQRWILQSLSKIIWENKNSTSLKRLEYEYYSLPETDEVFITVTVTHRHDSNLFKYGDSSSDEACKDERQNEKQGSLADLSCYLVHLAIKTSQVQFV